MSASFTGRRARSRHIARIALLISLGACSDPTASVPRIDRAHVAAAVAASTPTAVAIGNITGYGVNDAGTIVGPSSGKTSSAYLWDGSTGLELLGSGGLSWSIAGDGHTVGGKNAAGVPVVWTSALLAGPWTERVIPDACFGGAVRAIASDALGAPRLSRAAASARCNCASRSSASGSLASASAIVSGSIASAVRSTRRRRAERSTEGACG